MIGTGQRREGGICSICILCRKGAYTQPVRFVSSGTQGGKKDDDNESEEEVPLCGKRFVRLAIEPFNYKDSFPSVHDLDFSIYIKRL